MKYKTVFKKDVASVCKELRREFYLGEYRMNLLWSSTPQDEKGKTTIATIDIDNTYLTFGITIYPELQSIYERDKDRFFECLVHEFCHTLTEPLYLLAIPAASNQTQEILEEVRERQTQRITNMLEGHLKKLIFKPNGRKRVPKPKHRSNTRLRN